ncbi:hypothetical protein T484DRAFT_1829420 [Baffinella frigidus]|nr:hypothetical protein T484DRAFT_1829420 [Cryptophyta sp. CCMP2293]
MWVRPTGTGSLHPTSKRFFPGIHYYGTLSPPQPQVSWGKSLNPNGEVRIFTKCQFSGQDVPRGTRVVTSGAQNYEEGTMPMCYYDEMSFFNAIEINQPMLISPIMLIPEALPFSTVQELYYANHKEMSVRWGPQVTKQEREMNSKIQEREMNSKIQEEKDVFSPRWSIENIVEKDDFSPRSTLLSAPIIFQTRRNPSNECPFNFSTEFLSTSHDKVVEDVCASPFECEPEIMTNPEKTLACPGNESATWAKFSLDALEFGTETGYGDILYSITEDRGRNRLKGILIADSPFLFRDGRITGTDSFIDSMSSTVKLFLVFFTPRAGITSLMTVTADFMGDFEATVLCIVLVLIMGIDAAVKVPAPGSATDPGSA